MDFCHSDLGKKKCSLDVSTPYLNRAQLKSQPSKLRGKNQSMAMVLCCQRGWLPSGPGTLCSFIPTGREALR